MIRLLDTRLKSLMKKVMEQNVLTKGGQNIGKCGFVSLSLCPVQVGIAIFSCSSLPDKGY